MRILQVTNIVSHHQTPLARSLVSLVGEENFRFAVTHPLTEERICLGWEDVDNSWILRACESESQHTEFMRWWGTADVVLCGERLLKQFKQRVENEMHTFYMSERWWKPPLGMTRFLHPKFALMTKRFLNLTESPYFHILPIGVYAAHDFKRIIPSAQRMWCWGYYTETPDCLYECKRDGGFKVLWAGRMLGWKKVETLIRAFSLLSAERADALLTLVGDGPHMPRLKRLAKRLLRAYSYKFLPPQPIDSMLHLMRSHHVYVLPSNAYEGWGAVVNEAMAEGCAVIASDAAGSAKTMICQGQNGLLFESGDWHGLGKYLCQLANSENWRLQLARSGQQTIREMWSPDVAAARFIAVSDALLKRQPIPTFSDGPMAPASRQMS